ncbi:hypothetical protein [Mesorhizobium sp. CAU 1732]|uniref:hypothetical protein n=1 Tax=Mesorhizobium sp. CAU 1732 TaxID=3140358 RepID=UPI0032610D9E
MYVVVEPAKRPGRRREIFNRPVASTDLDLEDGVLMLSIVATGYHSDGSTYRFTIGLTRRDVEHVLDAVPAVSAEHAARGPRRERVA